MTLSTAPRSDRRTAFAQIVLVVIALAAAAAGIGAVSTAAGAGASTVVVEYWRAYGLLTFAVLFALLAWRPHGFRFLWELTIVNKVALTITGAALLGADDVDGASDLVLFDGVIALLLIAAYVTCRGWTTPSR